MGIVEAAGDRDASNVLADRNADPTVPRMLLGAQLRRLREIAGITRGQAARSIRCSESKISRLELGRTGFKARDVADLLTLYGVTDTAERTTLIALAEQANTPGWWQAYNDVAPPWLQAYLGLEQAASVIRTYEAQLIPGLLQTAEYARAVISLGYRDAPRRDVDRRVELRMRRQEVLRRTGAPYLWAVIDEAALRRPFGGPATMRAQFEHLIELCKLPHITVQVLPFHAGAHPAVGGSVTLLRMTEPELPDVVYLEQLTGATYPDKPADIEFYWDVLNRLVTQAEPPIATRSILDQISGDG